MDTKQLMSMMKTLRLQIIRFLEAYSPLALPLLIIPILLPLENEVRRRILLLFCAAPGILIALLQPKQTFKNPTLWLLILFLSYFSAQHIRGMLPVNAQLIRQTVTLGIIVLCPAFLLSRVTPERKPYTLAITTILIAASASYIYALHAFYENAPFPGARFSGLGHPVTSSRIMGFTTLLAGFFFLQTGKKITRNDWIPLFCVPVQMLAMCYTHSRSTLLAFFVASATALLGIRHRIMKTLILYAVITGTFGLYLASFHLPQKSVSSPPPQVTSTQNYDIRSAGVFSTSERQKTSTYARLDIWKDHFSRMNTPNVWLTGHGLGMRVFEKNPHPDAARWYYPTENGYTLLPHSGYVWALYHGGLIGLGILLLLMASAIGSAFRAKNIGIITLSLLIFSGVSLLTNMQRLLIGKGVDYLIFWVPLGLAAGISLSRNKKDSPDKI